MTIKTKLIILGIVIAVIMGILAVLHYAPFGSTLWAVFSFIAGLPVGWYLKNLKDKYFK